MACFATTTLTAETTDAYARLHEIIASEPLFVRRYRDLFSLPPNDPKVMQQPAARLIAEVHYQDIRTGVRALDGTPRVPAVPADDDDVVPDWDPDTSYLGTGDGVEMDDESLAAFLARGGHHLTNQAELEALDAEIDDERLMAMLNDWGR